MRSENRELKDKIEQIMRETLTIGFSSKEVFDYDSAWIENIEEAAEKIIDCVEGLD